MSDMRLIDADKLILHLNDYALQESPSNVESAEDRKISREKTCKSCRENDCGLCDHTGRLVEDDDQCEKWTGKQTDWRTRMMQTFLAGH